MKKIVISEFMDQAAIDGLSADYNTLYDPALVDRPEDLTRELVEAAALIVRNRTQVTADLLDKAPGVKVIGRLGVGLDNIDLEACKSRNVAVCPATGANDLSVAEYVLTSAATLLRRAYFGFDRMIAGDWPRQEMSGSELAGKTLGLVGFGSIARLTGQMAQDLGMEVHAMDPFVPVEDPAWKTATRVDTLEALLKASDIVSLHVPLTDGTRNLINAQALRQMCPDAILINAARGGVVDEAALAASLNAREIGGAALDVFASEPLTAEDAAKFAGLTNLILTPHIAGVTEQSNTRVSAVTAENVRRLLES